MIFIYKNQRYIQFLYQVIKYTQAFGDLWISVHILLLTFHYLLFQSSWGFSLLETYVLEKKKVSSF